jgi:two-component system, NarL family, nitrate/nitrite response regulator NarL
MSYTSGGAKLPNVELGTTQAPSQSIRGIRHERRGTNVNAMTRGSSAIVRSPRQSAKLGGASSLLRAWIIAPAMIFAIGVQPVRASALIAAPVLSCAWLGDANCQGVGGLSVPDLVMLRAKARLRIGRKPGRRSIRMGSAEGSPSLTTVSTLLVEESTLFREGLRLILEPTQFEVVASAAAIEELQAEDAGGILLLGAGGDLGVAARRVQLARKLYPSAHCVVLSDRYDPVAVGVVMEAGAAAYLLKNNSKDALVKALEMVMLGSTVLPTATPSAAIRLSREGEFPGREVEESIQGDFKTELAHHLSTREIETLYGLRAGSSNKQIAREFAIAEATVKVHVKAILRKIRVANRTQAAIWAMHHLPSRPIADETFDAAAMNGGIAGALSAPAAFSSNRPSANTG